MERRGARCIPSSTLLWMVSAVSLFTVWHLALTVGAGPSDRLSEAVLRDKNIVISHHSTECGCIRNVTVSEENTNGDETVTRPRWDWCGEESTLRGPHQKVVAYSIFGRADGNGKKYFESLNENAARIKRILPGWVIRMHHNLEKESSEHRLMCKAYCENPWMDLCDINTLWRTLSKRKRDRKEPDWRPLTGEQIINMNRRMWRFIPMLDPFVDVLLSRDLDALITDRELAALTQWFESDYTFHVMRDHHVHTAKILAGMFGVKNFQRRDLIDGLVRILVGEGQNQRYDTDQDLLAKIVWPVAKHDVMAHDSYNCKELWNALPTYPFPTQRENRSDFVSASPDGRWIYPAKCPVACRPSDHQDWEYC